MDEKRKLELAEIYQEINKYFNSKEEFDDFIEKILIFEIVLEQVTEIFKGSVFNAESEIVNYFTENNLQNYKVTFHKKFIEFTKEADRLMSIPELEEIVSWIETAYLEFLKNIFNEDYLNIVIKPSLEDISSAILEEAAKEKEELLKEMEEQDETHN